VGEPQNDKIDACLFGRFLTHFRPKPNNPRFFTYFSAKTAKNGQKQSKNGQKRPKTPKNALNYTKNVGYLAWDENVSKTSQKGRQWFCHVCGSPTDARGRAHVYLYNYNKPHLWLSTVRTPLTRTTHVGECVVHGCDQQYVPCWQEEHMADRTSAYVSTM